MISKSFPIFSDPDLCEQPAREVSSLLKTGEVTSSELLDAAFERIRAVEPAVQFGCSPIDPVVKHDTGSPA